MNRNANRRALDGPTDGRVDVLAGRSTDDEASAILDELEALQHWAVLLMCRQVEGAAAAGDLIQRTRILIIERCKRRRPSQGDS